VTSRAVLFDFDGTLADTAPDLAAAVNRMRTERGMASLSAAAVRPYASMGARGMLRIGFGTTPDDPAYAGMRDEFLRYYAAAICVQTRLFDGMKSLIASLAKKSIAWGIVTNKSMRLTEPLVQALELAPDCVVGGDSTPHLKPHPASLLLAAQQLKLAPARCVYVGDDLRDIQAARAAGMRCVAVEYGYHGVDNPGPRAWNADAVISRPEELLEHL